MEANQATRCASGVLARSRRLDRVEVREGGAAEAPVHLVVVRAGERGEEALLRPVAQRIQPLPRGGSALRGAAGGEDLPEEQAPDLLPTSSLGRPAERLKRIGRRRGQRHARAEREHRGDRGDEPNGGAEGAGDACDRLSAVRPRGRAARSLTQPDDPVREGERLRAMGHEDHGPPAPQRRQRVEDPRLGHRVEPCGRLVEEEDREAGGQGPGDSHPLPLPARELRTARAEAIVTPSQEGLRPDQGERVGAVPSRPRSTSSGNPRETFSSRVPPRMAGSWGTQANGRSPGPTPAQVRSRSP